MQGIYVVGKLQGYSEQDWAKGGKSGKNYRVGVVTHSYTDQFGGERESIQVIDILPERAADVRLACESHKGKVVQVPAVFRARQGGRDGAFLSCFMPKEGELKPLSVKA